MSEIEQTAESTTDDKWYTWFLYALGSLALSGFLWWYLTDFEENGGSRRVHWVIALLYNALGKVPTVGIFGLLGLVFAGVGVAQMLKKKG